MSELACSPGPDALIAPDWLPWDERVRAGDLAPGGLLAPRAGDPRLVPGYVATGDPVVDDLAFEVGLGRKQVMSLEGRLDAAERWRDGDYGPDTEMAKAAPSTCELCGFYLPLAGSLRVAFGVCGNEMAADGRVVYAEYGCGAHSDTELPTGAGSPQFDAYDDGAVEVVANRAPGRAARHRPRRRRDARREPPEARAPRRRRGIDELTVADPLGANALRESTLLAWTSSPTRLREDATTEADLVHAGYRDRLLTELAQNAADAAARAGVPGRLRVQARRHDAAGRECRHPWIRRACRRSRRSCVGKTDPAAGVGRFGVGFTAVLAVSEEIELRSTTGSVLFSAARTRAELAVAGLEAPAAGCAGAAPAVADRGRAGGRLDTEVVLALRRGVDGAARWWRGWPPRPPICCWNCLAAVDSGGRARVCARRARPRRRRLAPR